MREIVFLGASETLPAGLPLRTAMKGGLLGDRLSVSPRSEHEEARFVCCTLDWI